MPTVHRLVKASHASAAGSSRDPASRRLRLGLGAARLLPAVPTCPTWRATTLRGMAERTRRDREPRDARRRRGPLPGERGRQPPAHAALARGPAASRALRPRSASACSRSSTTRTRAAPPAASRTPRSPPRTITTWEKLRAQPRAGAARGRGLLARGVRGGPPLDRRPARVGGGRRSGGGERLAAVLARGPRRPPPSSRASCGPRRPGISGSGRRERRHDPLLARRALRAAQPALEGDVEVEACVIGGGVGGLSCARRLAQLGIETVLLEAGTVAGGASGRNGGFLIAGTGALPQRRARALRRRARARRCTRARSTRSGTSTSWPPSSAPATSLRQVGLLRLAVSEEEAEHVRAHAARAARGRLPGRAGGARRAAARAPAHRPRGLPHRPRRRPPPRALVPPARRRRRERRGADLRGQPACAGRCPRRTRGRW